MDRKRTPCNRTSEDVDYGDGPGAQRKYVMTCSSCGFEAWQHRPAVSTVVVGDFVPADVYERERQEAA